MVKKRLFLLLILSIITFLIGCSDSTLNEIKLSSSVNGKTVYATRGQIFIITLDVHADGGFNWNWQNEEDIKNITLVDINYTSPEGDIDGGMAKQIFRFKAERTGQCFITLVEYRSWEVDVDPTNTIQFRVSVR
jgi:predicted secreted protein